MLEEELIVNLRQYIHIKTGKQYFGRIKTTPTNIMVSCPYHKGGQETKPSCGIKRETDENGPMGLLHCFSCNKTTNLLWAVKDILGDKYDEDEVDARFGLLEMVAKSEFQEKPRVMFEIYKPDYVSDEELRFYRGKYHPYYRGRGIENYTIQKYDLGFDEYNQHITFPIRDVYGRCLGVGRRSVTGKQYIYPDGFIKPLYGRYELPRFIRWLWVVEGPFNLWSLYQYGKTGVALLGTGTSKQLHELLKIECAGYVLALDGDNAGRNGIKKIANFLVENQKKVYVACVPDNEDINSLLPEVFNGMEVLKYKEWLNTRFKKLN